MIRVVGEFPNGLLRLKVFLLCHLGHSSLVVQDQLLEEVGGGKEEGGRRRGKEKGGRRGGKEEG